jgi:integrase/recombinase XerD
MQTDGIRDVSQLVVLRLGRVVQWPGEVPGWELQNAADEPVVPVRQYLAEFAARDMSPASVRSYALALQRWYRVLWALGVQWDKATTAETRDFVLWMRQAGKHRPTEPTRHVPGSVNAKTGKRYLGDGYAPRTINHNLAVVHEFYDFHMEAGRGPFEESSSGTQGPANWATLRCPPQPDRAIPPELTGRLPAAGATEGSAVAA